MARKLKIMENEEHPLDDLKNEEITEKREKRKMHTEPCLSGGNGKFSKANT